MFGIRTHGVIASLFSLVTALPAQDGKTLYTIHCSACHLPDRQLVGPSLVEIRSLYSDKLDEFLAWSKEPLQKRQGVIQMPPMAHVGDDNLKLIHAYMLEASKGLEEVKVKGLDPYYASPSMRKRPQVMRLFMPDAGPAAIAVAVNDTLHYCWDAGECRLRYIWKGDFVDGWPVWKANGNALAKIQGEIFLREEKSPLPDAPGSEPKFLGYRLANGLPIFRYRVGALEVEETIVPTADGKALARSFTLSGSSPPKQLHFTATPSVTYTSDDGAWNESILELTPNPAGRYTITITPQP